jgi:hypothetical protein
LLDCFIYTVKNENTETGLTLKLVKNLVERYRGVWQTIHMDSFFSTIDTCNFLHRNSFNFIAMMNRNRTILRKAQKESTILKGESQANEK